MAKSESTRSKRLQTLSNARLEVDRELQSKVFDLLVALKSKQSEEAFDNTDLFPPARALAKELGFYSTLMQEGFQDSAHIIKEMGEERRKIAIELGRRAEEMLSTLESMPGLMRKFDYQDSVIKCLGAVIAESEKAANENTCEPKRKGIGRARTEIARYIAYAWEVTTGRGPEKLKRNLEGKPYGEFYDFIRSVLELTPKTRSINAETLQKLTHRRIG